MTATGRVLFGVQPVRVERTTPEERAAARRLWRRSQSAAWRLFPSMAAARARGYAIDPERPPDDLQILRPHLTNKRLVRDGKTLDPTRPESLVYQRRTDGRLQLVAFMYRAASGPFTPTPEGQFVRWHLHGGCVERDTARGVAIEDDRCPEGRVLHYGDTMMFHLWLTEDDLGTAFADDPPPRLRGGRWSGRAPRRLPVG